MIIFDQHGKEKTFKRKIYFENQNIKSKRKKEKTIPKLQSKIMLIRKKEKLRKRTKNSQLTRI